MERYKKRLYTGIPGTTYFWRTHDGQEVDIVEESNGELSGYECKWSDTKGMKIPKDWENVGKVLPIQIVNRENYMDFIL